MHRDRTHRDIPKADSDRRTEAHCWKELLDQAAQGTAPIDQTIEHILDRMDRGRR